MAKTKNAFDKRLHSLCERGNIPYYRLNNIDVNRLYTFYIENTVNEFEEKTIKYIRKKQEER